MNPREMPPSLATRDEAKWRLLRNAIPAFLKGVIRRQTDQLLPSREVREYRRWMRDRLIQRRAIYAGPVPKNLLSILTPVWNGSPVRYLRALAESVIAQNRGGACEWVILDNGCSSSGLLGYLGQLSQYNWIKLQRTNTNIGIAAGLRLCLERASGRYLLPVDADDLLYPDALAAVSSHVEGAGYPPLLYTDEDKVIGTRFYQPYFKPDWDPVLFLNSAYTAHLGIIDRQKALELGAYQDAGAEGSPDWDVFVRFLIAGYAPVHVAEVLYSWRVHAHSTADDSATKPYIHSSQKAVLERFLNAQPHPERFSIQLSPLLAPAAHWRFLRRHTDPKPFACVVLASCAEGAAECCNSSAIRVARRSDPRTLLPLAQEMTEHDGFIHFIDEELQVEDRDWAWEALGIFELHPDTVMIGGRIHNSKGVVVEAGDYFGFGGFCGCPHRGRSVLDPGYSTQIWKQRSVSAVSIQFSAVRAVFLAELLRELPPNATLPFLGAWAGARAIKTGKRVVYSPFLSGVSDLDWRTLVDATEEKMFGDIHRDLIPDRRFYPRPFSLEKGFELSTNASQLRTSQSATGR